MLHLKKVTFLTWLPICLLVACSGREAAPTAHQGPDPVNAPPLEVQAVEVKAGSHGWGQNPTLGIGGSVEGLALDCQQETIPSGGSCVPTEPGNACQECVAERCCTEQSACNSLHPMNSCAFGSTLFSGRSVEGGEIACMMECLAGMSSDGSLNGDQADLTTCSEQCAASECDQAHASETSENLAACILGDPAIAEPGCRTACGLSP